MFEDFDSRFGNNVLALKGDAHSDVLFVLNDVSYRCEIWCFLSLIQTSA